MATAAVTTLDRRDVRAASGICTPAAVAELAKMPAPTLRSWMRPAGRRPVMVHTVPTMRRGWPSVPLVGLAEASALRALRSTLSMQRVTAAAEYIRDRFGDEFALANPKLVTDGSAAFLHDEATDEVTRIPDGQGALTEVFREHLRPLLPGDDGYVAQFHVRRFQSSQVVIDPTMNAGRMYFTRTGVPLFVVAGALRAGERPALIADDFGLTWDEVTEVESNLGWLEAVA